MVYYSSLYEQNSTYLVFYFLGQHSLDLAEIGIDGLRR